jgi:hypothetical protein
MTRETVFSKVSENTKAKWPDADVEYLILDNGNFIVFIDSDIDVDWETTPAYDEKGPKDAKRHNDILNRAAAIECIPNDHQRESIRMNFKRMIGEGVARSLDHDYDNATKILDQAEKYIIERNIETARIWQLTSSTVAGLACAFVGLVPLWSFRSFFLQNWGQAALFSCLAACAGGVGANLSFIFRIGKTRITSEAIKRLHILESICRILGGAICGLIVSLLIQLGILISIFKSANNMHLAMVTAGFIAGASERWVPSLIAKIESSSMGEKEKSS